MAEADSVLPGDGADSRVRLRVPVPDCPAALSVHPNFNRINTSLPPNRLPRMGGACFSGSHRRGRIEQKCAPKPAQIRPRKPLETNGGTDELAWRAWLAHGQSLVPQGGWGKTPTSPVARPQSSENTRIPPWPQKCNEG